MEKYLGKGSQQIQKSFEENVKTSLDIHFNPFKLFMKEVG